MSAQRAEVLDSSPAYPLTVATVDDFRLGAPSEADASVGLGPGWSLYCLELEEPRSAVFVRTDEPLDLQGTFIYTQQRDRALEALVVPLDEFLALAEEVPAPADLAFLFSTGRCGSTLASRIIARLPGVACLSEPDVYSNLVRARTSLDPGDAAALLRATTAVLCQGVGAGWADQVVVKPRSEPVLHEEVYAAAFPAARHAFMYRDVLGYTASLNRYAHRMIGELPRMSADEFLDGWNGLTAYEPLATLGQHIDLERTDFGVHELYPAIWALRIRAHLDARERGDGSGPIEAIHYDDLVADRETETARLLSACGLDEGLTPQVLGVFERDAHAGMAGANEAEVHELTPREMSEILAQLPRLGLPTYKTERL